MCTHSHVSVRCGCLDCGYLHVNLGSNVCIESTEKESMQAADSGEPFNPSVVSNKSSTTLQCTTCIDWISADLC